MTDLLQLNDEVEINQRDIVVLDNTWIKRIKELAQENSSGKYRTCIHQSEKDDVHEMLIVHTSGTYVRPHKHKINGESLQFIEGNGIVIIFNNDGDIRQSFRVGDPLSDNTFYYSLGKELFHMLIIESEFLVFKETTKGPFIRENTVYPTWAPDGNDEKENKTFISKIITLLDKNGL